MHREQALARALAEGSSAVLARRFLSHSSGVGGAADHPVAKSTVSKLVTSIKRSTNLLTSLAVFAVTGSKLR